MMATMNSLPQQQQQQQQQHPASRTNSNSDAVVMSTEEPNTGSGLYTCAQCEEKICDRFLLHSMDKHWHTFCLKCSSCGVSLSEKGNTCYTKAGMVLCKEDYVRLFGTSGACRACQQTIPATEMVMRVKDSVYHLKCFHCAACHIALMPGDRFNMVNGNLFCEQDNPFRLLKGGGNPTTTNTTFNGPMLRANGKVYGCCALTMWCLTVDFAFLGMLNDD